MSEIDKKALATTIYHRTLWLQVMDHWVDNLVLAQQGRLKIHNIGASECAFCKVYLNDKKSCSNSCPIKEQTGNDLCQGTPWFKVVCAIHTGEDVVEAVKEEIRYLTRLRFLIENCD